MSTCRVPTRPGKPGKMRVCFPVMEKYWNFTILLKILEKWKKFWKNVTFWKSFLNIHNYQTLLVICINLLKSKTLKKLCEVARNGTWAFGWLRGGLALGSVV